MPDTEMKTLTCPGPPEHEFKIPKGRGRPPRYCSEHKPNGNNAEGSKVEKTEDKKTRKAPPKSNGSNSDSKPARRAPRINPGPDKTWADDPDPKAAKEKSDAEDGKKRDEGIRRLPPPGSRDTGSRAKAEKAADHAESQQPDTDQSWPRGVNGKPMSKIEFSASELIPTGQYANVSVGPARITTFVDLSREVEEGESYFTDDERDNLIKATNELAEMVEANVIAVQRNLVLESLQGEQG